MFPDSANNIELSTAVTSFIRKCIGDVVPTVNILPQSKPWINTEVGAILKDRATTHRAIADNPEATAKDRNKFKSRNDLVIRWNHTTQAPKSHRRWQGLQP